MVTEANLLQHYMGNTDEIIIDKTYFKIAGDSNDDSDGQGGSNSDREPNSQNQLNDFADMVRRLDEARQKEEDWFNEEGKGSNLDDVDADSNQKEVKQVDSFRVNVNRKLRNFFGY